MCVGVARGGVVICHIVDNDMWSVGWRNKLEKRIGAYELHEAASSSKTLSGDQSTRTSWRCLLLDRGVPNSTPPHHQRIGRQSDVPVQGVIGIMIRAIVFNMQSAGPSMDTLYQIG